MCGLFGALSGSLGLLLNLNPDIEFKLGQLRQKKSTELCPLRT